MCLSSLGKPVACVKPTVHVKLTNDKNTPKDKTELSLDTATVSNVKKSVETNNKNFSQNMAEFPENQCQYCQKFFKGKSGLKEHIGKFRCPVNRFGAIQNQTVKLNHGGILEKNKPNTIAVEIEEKQEASQLDSNTLRKLENLADWEITKSEPKETYKKIILKYNDFLGGDMSQEETISVQHECEECGAEFKQTNKLMVHKYLGWCHKTRQKENMKQKEENSTECNENAKQNQNETQEEITLELQIDEEVKEETIKIIAQSEKPICTKSKKTFADKRGFSQHTTNMVYQDERKHFKFDSSHRSILTSLKAKGDIITHKIQPVVKPEPMAAPAETQEQVAQEKDTNGEVADNFGDDDGMNDTDTRMPIQGAGRADRIEDLDATTNMHLEKMPSGYRCLRCNYSSRNRNHAL